VFKVLVSVCVVVCCSHINSARACRTVRSPACIELLTGLRRTVWPHDDDNYDFIIPRHNHFGAARFYCVETITAPCGVVIAWVKFDKSESPTNILNWLEKIYPTQESRPHYICIDKAC
jgi:hypothetical protein